MCTCSSTYREPCCWVSLLNLKSPLNRLQSSLKSVCRSSAAICSLLWGKNHNQKRWHFRSLRQLSTQNPCSFHWPTDQFRCNRSLVSKLCKPCGRFRARSLLSQQLQDVSFSSPCFCASSSSSASSSWIISSKSLSRCLHDSSLSVSLRIRG